MCLKLHQLFFRFVLAITVLDASSHLYNRVCPSVRPSVRPSVCPRSLCAANLSHRWPGRCQSEHTHSLDANLEPLPQISQIALMVAL